jgi:hypothetical protein
MAGIASAALLPVLRAYQKDLVRSVLARLEEHDVGWIGSPCGTGKSICLYALLHARAPQAAVVFVPLLQLIRQFSYLWRSLRQDGYDWRLLIFCGDNRVLSLTKKQLEEHVAPLVPLGITLDVKEAAGLARAELAQGGRVLALSTYRSAPVACEWAAEMGPGFRAGLVACDEAHNLKQRKSGARAPSKALPGSPARKRLRGQAKDSTSAAPLKDARASSDRRNSLQSASRFGFGFVSLWGRGGDLFMLISPLRPPPDPRRVTRGEPRPDFAQPIDCGSPVHRSGILLIPGSFFARGTRRMHWPRFAFRQRSECS